jgi:hypothetical protein
MLITVLLMFIPVCIHPTLIEKFQYNTEQKYNDYIEQKYNDDPIINDEKEILERPKIWAHTYAQFLGTEKPRFLNFWAFLKSYDKDDFDWARKNTRGTEIENHRYYKTYRYFWNRCEELDKTNIVQKMKKSFNRNMNISFVAFEQTKIKNLYGKERDKKLFQYYWLWVKMETYIRWKVYSLGLGKTSFEDFLKQYKDDQNYLLYINKKGADFEAQYDTAKTFWKLVYEYVTAK